MLSRFSLRHTQIYCRLFFLFIYLLLSLVLFLCLFSSLHLLILLFLLASQVSVVTLYLVALPASFYLGLVLKYGVVGIWGGLSAAYVLQASALAVAVHHLKVSTLPSTT